MNQKNKKSRNYREESAGSNVLFTLGLVSVVALLIVGWVMTQGGMQNVFSDHNTLPPISVKPNESAAPTPTPKPAAENSLNTTAAPSVIEDRQALRSQIEAKVRREYDEKIQALEQRLQKEKEELRQKFQSQVEDLKMQIQMLEIDNRNLREEG